MAKNAFPTEMVDLPSKGWFYDSDNPLSSGQVELKYMTAKEEDILTSTNLIKKGIVFDKLLQALIVDKKVKYDDILIGDKNAIMVAARILGYGKDYPVQYPHPDTDELEEVMVDLTSLDDKEIDFTQYEKGVNKFEMTLPASKRVITYKLLDQRDERVIDSELKSMKKINPEIDSDITTRMKRTILSIDGDDKRQAINHFVDNEFLSRDSLHFRTEYAKMTPDVNMTADVVFSDGSERSIGVPMTPGFFWPNGWVQTRNSRRNIQSTILL